MYREDIGYCQGMQSVSALMLMMMTEEETFWMLASLADDVKFRICSTEENVFGTRSQIQTRSAVGPMRRDQSI